MPGNTLDTASVDQLLKAIRERFSYKSVTPEQASLKIYEEFLKRCDKLMLQAIQRICGFDKNLIKQLRIIATNCIVVDRATTTNTLAKIEEVHENLYRLSVGTLLHLPESLIEYKPYKRNDLAARALVKQAFAYLKESFKPNMHMFDSSATKISDAADILELAQCIYSADLEGAKEKSHLDTVVREDIPASAWKWMEKNL